MVSPAHLSRQAAMRSSALARRQGDHCVRSADEVLTCLTIVEENLIVRQEIVGGPHDAVTESVCRPEVQPEPPVA